MKLEDYMVKASCNKREEGLISKDGSSQNGNVYSCGAK